MMNNQRRTGGEGGKWKKIKCADSLLWEQSEHDFFADIIYYFTSAPTTVEMCFLDWDGGGGGRGGADYPDHFLFIAVSHKPCAWRRIDVRKMLLIYEANELGTLGADFLLSRASSPFDVLSLAHTARANALLDRGWILFLCACVAHKSSMTTPSSRTARRHIHIHQWTDIFSS